MKSRIKSFTGEYRQLSEYDKNLIFYKFLDDSFQTCTKIGMIFFIGIILLTILDYTSGFYQADPMNVLNFYAEMIIIISSGISAALGLIITKKHGQIDSLQYEIRARKYKQAIITLYKICLLVGICLFITTDVKVRGVFLGTYLIYFFLLLIIPFYKSWKNFIFFVAPGVYLGYLYFQTVGPQFNLMLGETSIFLAFYIVSEYIRMYFIRQAMNNRKIQQDNERIKRLVSQIIQALSGAVEVKDEYTQGHSRRVADYSKKIAKGAGYSSARANQVYQIALLHDVGKIGIDDCIINSKSKLTDEEFAIIKSHPTMGYNILKQITEFPEISQGARWHHERFDGGGYPDGLAGEEIPEIARIIAVADAYDAMTSNRSYRDMMPQAAVREQIEINMGKQFDPKFGQIMLDMIDADTHYRMHE